MEEDVDEVVAEGGQLVHQVVQPDKWHHQDDLGKGSIEKIDFF